ncbi:MAG: FHA domain-containing protein [Pseudomonadota bacterium]
MGGPKITIGRGGSADIRLDDPTVSRLHAEARLMDDGGIEVTDLDSKNGMFLRRGDGEERASRAVVDARASLRFGGVSLSADRIDQALRAATAKTDRRGDRGPTDYVEMGSRGMKEAPKGFAPRETGGETPPNRKVKPPAKRGAEKRAGRAYRDPETNEIRFKD